MLATYYDPLPDSPYYLRILDSIKDADSIRDMRIQVLKSQRLWDPENPGIKKLAEPIHGAVYTELRHRDGKTAGMLEAISYDAIAEFQSTYPMLGYYRSFLESKSDRTVFHLRSVYLCPAFRQRRQSFLFLSFLNALYFQNLGIAAFAYCSLEAGALKRLGTKLQVTENTALKAVLKLEGNPCKYVGEASVRGILNSCLDLYRKHTDRPLPNSWYPKGLELA